MPRKLRAAFLAPTSDDEVQDPTIFILRQLRNCLIACGQDMEIVVYFWDVETSRQALTDRGTSTAWQKFDIAIPRDGGDPRPARRGRPPDRRFDVVIRESTDRIARFAYQSTKIEYDLEQLGIPLAAADEPVIRSAKTGKIEKKSAQVLLRRTKQGVAEWYVMEMLEKSRQGLEVHTEQGFTVGKPPYGYLPEKIKHPVPARHAQGRHKTRYTPDAVRGPVVETIFEWRVGEKLGYRAIADRLNEDLDRGDRVAVEQLDGGMGPQRITRIVGLCHSDPVRDPASRCWRSGQQGRVSGGVAAERIAVLVHCAHGKRVTQ